MVKLSVIIKLEEHFANTENSIKSICTYMGKDIEIIVAASDKFESGNEKLSKLEEKDKRIKVFRNGLCNDILNELNGKYFLILDSYDMLSHAELIKIMSKIRKAENDIIISGYGLFFNENIIDTRSLLGDMTELNKISKNETLMKRLLIPSGDHHTFDSLLIKLDFYKSLNIGLETLGNKTDSFSTKLEMFDRANSVLYCNIPLFLYQKYKEPDIYEFDYTDFDVFKKHCDFQNKYLTKWNASLEISSEVYKYEFIKISQLFFKAFASCENKNNLFPKLKETLKSEWVKNILNNVNGKGLDNEYKKRLSAFKLGNIQMIWVLYKLQKR